MTQSRAQDDLQTNMRITQALLEQTSTAAANLQTMMDETYGMLRDSPTLRNVFGPFSPGHLVALVFSLIGAHSSRLALGVLLIYVGKLLTCIVLWQIEFVVIQVAHLLLTLVVISVVMRVI